MTEQQADIRARITALRAMRLVVFARDAAKRDAKVAEIDRCLTLLESMKDLAKVELQQTEQPSLFEEKSGAPHA